MPDHAAPPPAPTAGQAPAGRVLAWMKVDAEIGDAADRGHRSLHQSWLAFLSDDLPTDSVRSSHPVARHESEHFFGTSLDHTIWFHRPFRMDEWLLFAMESPNASGGRGLCFAHVYNRAGELVATLAQEGLIRLRGPKS